MDWQQNPVPNDGTFISSTTYDALNRPTIVTAPDGSIHRPTYNEANLLDTVEVNLHGEAARTPFVTDINYNAKGQRELIAYGNGAQTQYEYDPLTFRLTRLRTTRSVRLNGLASQLFTDPVVVQDLRYTYDPVGNITRIEDRALQTIFHNNEQVQPVCTYTYDAVYRLLKAEGREHIGQTAHDFNPPDHNRRDYPFAGLQAHPNDMQALRNYTEGYEYDAVGNFQSMQHIVTGGGWTQRYEYHEASLIEPAKQSNRLTKTTIGNGFSFIETYTYTDAQRHDVDGCITSINNMKMVWDSKDQLQQVDLDGGGTAYYVYDGGGQRIRKVWEKAPGLTEERSYLGGFEVFRRRNGVGTITLERETLHIMDDKQRIALVETRTQGNDPAPQQLIRYQLGNHLGWASLELNEQAQVISYEEYYPYGSTSYQAVRSQTEAPKRYRYTGKERDEESGLSYHKGRYYAPWLGRWASGDPMGLVDGGNLFQYVGGRPTVKKDPTGAFGLPSTSDIKEQYHQEKALAVARIGSYAITAKALVEHTVRDAEEAYAGAIEDKSYTRPRVQSVLGGAFLRMYLDHAVDPLIIKAAGEEIKHEPEFKRLEEQIERKVKALGSKLVSDRAGDLLKGTIQKHLENRLKSGGGGIEFKYETNTIIGGVSGAEVKSAQITRVKTDNGVRADYQIDITFKDTYDFENKRTGVYDRYRKELAGYLSEGKYDKFWEAFETEAYGKGTTGLDNAAVFASFMYAIEKKGWTPEPLPWDVTIPVKGSVLIPSAPQNKHSVKKGH